MQLRASRVERDVPVLSTSDISKIDPTESYSFSCSLPEGWMLNFLRGNRLLKREKGQSKTIENLA